MTSKKRRRRKSTFADIIGLFASIAMIIIAVLLIVFVYFYIKNNSFFEGLPFISNTQKETILPTEEGKDSDQEGSAEDRKEYIGLTRLTDGSLVYVLTDSEVKDYEEDQILHYEKDGVSVLANSWLCSGDYLYYFGKDGLAVRDYAEGAMEYSFDRDYILESITYNKNYSGNISLDGDGYTGIVKTKALWAYVDKKDSISDLYAVCYKKTTDSLSHVLGGSKNAQYSSPYALSIEDGYIYYLAVTNSSDKVIEPIANKLFRMKPGAEFREIAAEDVEGYKVFKDKDGKTKVFIYDGYEVICTDNFEEDKTMRVFPENAKYIVEIEDDKAILKLEGGYPVTLESNSFTAGNFVYKINDKGEILSVESKNKVSMGGYTYTAENGEAFGTKKCRILRQSTDGIIEVISTEFVGELNNLHYDFDSSRIIAEVKDSQNSAGLLSISLDGDVDIVSETSGLGAKCELVAIQSGKAIVKTANGYKEISLSATYPFAVGIDPIVIENDEPKEETETVKASDYDTSVLGEVKETAASSISGPPSAGGNGSAISNGPGSEGGSSAPGVINNNTVELKGPGET